MPSVRSATLWLGGFVAIAYVVIGVAGVLWPGHWDEASALDQILWGVFAVGGGVLLGTGLRLLDRSPRAAALLVSLGAVLGALPVFWALLPVLLALALVVLSILHARRPAHPA